LCSCFKQMLYPFLGEFTTSGQTQHSAVKPY
jgi:hypothetical protein